MFHITPECEEDAPQIEMLLENVFGAHRHRKTVQRMRAGHLPPAYLSFVLRNNRGSVIGTIRLWDIEAGNVAAVLLGPLAIAPGYRNKGLGASLVKRALATARTMGHRAVILVGDASYYQRFGFSRGLTLNLKMPGPIDEERFLGLELVPGALANASGMVRMKGRRKQGEKNDHLHPQEIRNDKKAG